MDKSRDGKHSSKEFTDVISRNIEAGHEKNYDDWLQRFMISERQFPGLGTTIIARGGNISTVRYIINRFADQASLDAWENSSERIFVRSNERSSTSFVFFEGRPQRS